MRKQKMVMGVNIGCLFLFVRLQQWQLTSDWEQLLMVLY